MAKKGGCEETKIKSLDLKRKVNAFSSHLAADGIKGYKKAAHAHKNSTKANKTQTHANLTQLRENKNNMRGKEK